MVFLAPFLLSFIADSLIWCWHQGLLSRDSHPACSNYLFGQSLLKGLNYTEHSYLQMIKHLIRINFSKTWDVLEGCWYIAHRTGRNFVEVLSFCCLSPSVSFIFSFCTIFCYLRKGLCSHPLA